MPANSQPGNDDGAVLQRKPMRGDADLDITPMIDITFLLLIFFLVASIPDSQTAVDLPQAVHGTAVNPRTSVIVTIAKTDGDEPQIYLNDGKVGSALPEDHAAQEEQILAALEEGFIQGKSTLLLKFDKGVKYRHISRVAALAGRVEGMLPHFAVLEADE